MCRGTAPANSSSSGTKLRPSPEARSEASTGTPDVPCTCRPAAATSSMHRNSSRMQQKSSQNLQQPRAIEINCAAMTWSERSELSCVGWCVHCKCTYSDDARNLLCPIHVIRAFMLTSRAVAYMNFYFIPRYAFSCSIWSLASL